jgi:hypothetical protein
MKLLHCLVLATPLLTVACFHQNGEEYFPAPSSSGRSEYSITYRNASGVVQHASMVSYGDGEETINGKRYTKMIADYSEMPGMDRSVGFTRRTREGIYVIEGARDQPEHIETRFPVKVGTSWTRVSPKTSVDNKAVGLETVQLGDNIFHQCLKIDFTSRGALGQPSCQGSEYLAPDVGLVKMVTTCDNDVTMTISLTKYKR